MLKQFLKFLVPMAPRANDNQVRKARPVLVWTVMVPNEHPVTVETVVDMIHVVDQETVQHGSEESMEEVPQVDVIKKKRVSFSTQVAEKDKSVPCDNHSSPPRTKSSSSQQACRYCFEPNGDLISPCKCSGSQSFVHVDCMREWIQKSSQVNCGICRATVQGFRSRKHFLYYSAEIFIVISVLSLVLLYFGSNVFVRNCPRIVGVEKCSPAIVSAAVMVHLAAPLLLFVVFWLSTFFVRFKVMVTVYDPSSTDPCSTCRSKSSPSLDQGASDKELTSQ